MDMTTIGRQIAALRKERGSKQEELANHVGVSAQAVSKWENGGVPDTELLPAIADFFGVSIDALFGRNMTDYGDLQAALAKKIAETPQEERFAQVMEFCWDMERAMFGFREVRGILADTQKTLEDNEQRYSSINIDSGITRMGLGNRLQYFLVVPETKDTQSAFFDGIDYPAFFRDFGENDVFEACVMLNRRDSEKAFTTALLSRKLGLTPERAQEVIEVLIKYRLIEKTVIELDDEIQTVYKFYPTPSFVALLIFAHEMIDTPRSFNCMHQNRNKPYFNS